MKKQKLQFDLFSTYLAAVKNSVGSKFFRNMYALNGRKQIDILENGNLSCAYFVSTILRHFMLIKKVHTTVKNTVLDMKKSGWKSLNKPKIGSVLIYEEKYFPESGNRHIHIGFFVGNGKTISTSSKYRTPIIHGWQKEPSSDKPRKVIEILWHKKLTGL